MDLCTVVERIVADKKALQAGGESPLSEGERAIISTYRSRSIQEVLDDLHQLGRSIVDISRVDDLIDGFERQLASVGMSKRALAKVTGLARSNLTRIFQRLTKNPSLDTVASIAAALDYSLFWSEYDYAAETRDEDDNSWDDENELIEESRSIDTDDIDSDGRDEEQNDDPQGDGDQVGVDNSWDDENELIEGSRSIDTDDIDDRDDSHRDDSQDDGYQVEVEEGTSDFDVEFDEAENDDDREPEYEYAADSGEVHESEADEEYRYDPEIEDEAAGEGAYAADSNNEPEDESENDHGYRHDDDDDDDDDDVFANSVYDVFNNPRFFPNTSKSVFPEVFPRDLINTQSNTLTFEPRARPEMAFAGAALGLTVAALPKDERVLAAVGAAGLVGVVASTNLQSKNYRDAVVATGVCLAVGAAAKAIWQRLGCPKWVIK